MGMGPLGDVMGLNLLKQIMPKMPDIPTPPKPEPPPQESKLPDIGVIQKQLMGAGQAGGQPGVGSTMLTGPGGIQPSMLTLGKSTLLGQ